MLNCTLLKFDCISLYLYSVSLRIQSECGKIRRAKKKSGFVPFSRNERINNLDICQTALQLYSSEIVKLCQSSCWSLFKNNLHATAYFFRWIFYSFLGTELSSTYKGMQLICLKSMENNGLYYFLSW